MSAAGIAFCDRGGRQVAEATPWAHLQSAPEDEIDAVLAKAFRAPSCSPDWAADLLAQLDAIDFTAGRSDVIRPHNAVPPSSDALSNIDAARSRSAPLHS